MTMRTEEQLIDGIKSGNKEDFSLLIDRYQLYSLKVAFRFLKDRALAEDVVQESFIKVYRKINLFEGRSSFKSWLTRILLNTCKNKLRKHSRETLGFETPKPSRVQGPESSMIQLDIGEMLKREIDLLPEKQKQALMLRVYEDMSFKEVADIMDSPYDTAKANYRHALMKLREKFESCDLLKSWMNETNNGTSHWLGEIMEVDV
ncbi:sigma-70 family RNA polymerase sigma factor [bacterium]|nr:sigma-70 family RNA polymerase sigma factor [bacterium]